MALRLAISIGDINGIGPEVALKTLAEYSLEKVTPIILSHPKVVDYYAQISKLEINYHHIESEEDIRDNKINVLQVYPEEQILINPGVLTRQNGKNAMLAVEKGIDLCLANSADALITAPISKEGVNLAGYDIPGHTEFLAERTESPDYMMMLVHDQLRVGLVTIHVPVSEIDGLVKESTVYGRIEQMHQSLTNDFGITEPSIAVLGLNPHAGDGGYIGRKEITDIAPAIEQARTNYINVSDPQPADSFFGGKHYKKYDGVLAMYHDQGLIPFKTLSFGSGVNFTAGLPIVRTSPDHGTAFDIAGTDSADPSSFRQAFKLAAQLAQKRKQEKYNA